MCHAHTGSDQNYESLFLKFSDGNIILLIFQSLRPLKYQEKFLDFKSSTKIAKIGFYGSSS